jgi:hypothetical protein
MCLFAYLLFRAFETAREMSTALLTQALQALLLCC